ncbi:MAG: hypothetical protein CMF49_02620 [Legionellales bacterium]|nr:hypothetical protein [Legionellales bacterium]|tara:strand:+ start:535 stop:987 length:453 start_codon:yes stop_codon:yes gene_type:complete
MKNEIALPESISPDELLARSIFCGFERKSLKTKIDIDNNIARPSLFIDNRNPWELSVNRISYYEGDKHTLGIEHYKKHPTHYGYSGYAEIAARDVFEIGCSIEKDDVKGTNPFHANIKYPAENPKEKCMACAVKLAFKSTLILHNNVKIT